MSPYSNYIKRLVLEGDEDLSCISDLLESNYDEVIQGFLSALLVLINTEDKNAKKIDDILKFIEYLCSTSTNTKHLECIFNKLKNTIYLLKQNDSVNQGQTKNIIQKIDVLKELIEKRKEKIFADVNFKILEEIIYKEHNLAKLHSLISLNSNILNSTDEYGCDILYLLIKKFISLNNDNIKEINYLYQVIILIFNSSAFKDNTKDLAVYSELLKNDPAFSTQKHIRDLYDRLNEKKLVPLEKLQSKYRVNLNYPYKLEQESTEFILDNKNRYDFTKQNCITIDGVDDKCLDDALYIEKKSNGTYTLFVHITDLPSFIPYNSQVNKEAMRRGETLYLCDTVSSIYSENIANNVCSLLPNCNRNTISYVFLLDSKFDVIDFKITKGKINVKHRLNYDEVDKMLKRGGTTQLDLMLRDLSNFSLRHKNKNPTKNKYRQFENKISKKEHHQSIRADYSASANIVQEAMIIVNRYTPRYFKKLSLPYPNRVLHILDDDIYIEKLNYLLLNDKIVLTPKERDKVIKQLKDCSWRAKYSVSDYGHDGIGYTYYSHSTSPARRAMDGFGQYLIYDFIFQKKLDDTNVHKWEDDAKRLCNYLNERKMINDAFSNQYNYLVSKNLIKKR